MSNATTSQNAATENLIDAQTAYYRVWTAIGEVILYCLTCATARVIGRRIDMLSKAAFIPDSGSGNDAACAFLMGMTDRGFYQLAHRRHVPRTKPGEEFIYRFSDVPKQWDDPQTSETLRPGCASESESVPARRKPKKK